MSLSKESHEDLQTKTRYPSVFAPVEMCVLVQKDYPLVKKHGWRKFHHVIGIPLMDCDYSQYIGRMIPDNHQPARGF